MQVQNLCVCEFWLIPFYQNAFYREFYYEHEQASHPSEITNKRFVLAEMTPPNI